ncbi:hypothetical protein HFX_2540 [Haloferax mediterranei ATCC 33500]|uniref:Uncharacterized protein n=1 Tax=Haloferax mediterranei (strain ATCC 33500 / DSM 1411 / JCM 8866 / NBRC 14739 / NCIMB 2177 / R-4) TaxID=523841 RepID=I3R7L1_HALMT|nr:hypothetical protein HFX_2540 [Haloferax mediterranei ATCC 33500]
MASTQLGFVCNHGRFECHKYSTGGSHSSVSVDLQYPSTPRGVDGNAYPANPDTPFEPTNHT